VESPIGDECARSALGGSTPSRRTIKFPLHFQFVAIVSYTLLRVCRSQNDDQMTTPASADTANRCTKATQTHGPITRGAAFQNVWRHHVRGLDEAGSLFRDANATRRGWYGRRSLGLAYYSQSMSDSDRPMLRAQRNPAEARKRRRYAAILRSLTACTGQRATGCSTRRMSWTIAAGSARWVGFCEVRADRGLGD
jgi:hypothetical protein